MPAAQKVVEDGLVQGGREDVHRVADPAEPRDQIGGDHQVADPQRRKQHLAERPDVNDALVGVEAVQRAMGWCRSDIRLQSSPMSIAATRAQSRICKRRGAL